MKPFSSIPKLGHTLDRFNQGCSFFQAAIGAWGDGELLAYEAALRKAATEAIGALEWALKVYLRSFCRARMAAEDVPKLRRPNFDDLMTLMRKYADPPLKTNTVSLLYEYRDLFRNAAEHDASVPPSQELHDAIEEVREVILSYLPVDEHQLRTVRLDLRMRDDAQRGTASKPMSIKEFILEREPQSDIQKALAIGYYLEKYEGLLSFNVRDLADGFRAAKEAVPGNVGDKVQANIRKGHMMEAKDKKENLKAWMLTSTGEKHVANGFDHEC